MLVKEFMYMYMLAARACRSACFVPRCLVVNRKKPT